MSAVKVQGFGVCEPRGLPFSQETSPRGGSLPLNPLGSQHRLAQLPPKASLRGWTARLRLQLWKVAVFLVQQVSGVEAEIV